MCVCVCCELVEVIHLVLFKAQRAALRLWVRVCLDHIADLSKNLMGHTVEPDRGAVNLCRGTVERSHGAVVRVCVVGLYLCKTALGNVVDNDAGAIAWSQGWRLFRGLRYTVHYACCSTGIIPLLAAAALSVRENVANGTGDGSTGGGFTKCGHTNRGSGAWLEESDEGGGGQSDGGVGIHL